MYPTIKPQNAALACLQTMARHPTITQTRFSHELFYCNTMNISHRLHDDQDTNIGNVQQQHKTSFLYLL